MSDVQSRRTISINRALFDRSRERARVLGVPLSSLAECAIERLISDPKITAEAIIVVRRAKPPKKPSRLSLSRRAAYYRAEHGCTLHQAAQRFGITAQAVSNGEYSNRAAAHVLAERSEADPESNDLGALRGTAALVSAAREAFSAWQVALDLEAGDRLHAAMIELGRLVGVEPAPPPPPDVVQIGTGQ